jgi:hypothetical protein
MMRNPKSTVTAYWVSTAAVAVAFLLPGIGNLIHVPHIASDMAHLGYPRYFSTLLGGWKVLGAVTVLAPGLGILKEWAYAGMVFDLTGAAVSRGATGDGVAMMLVPLALCGLVLTSRSLRPSGRRASA